MFACDNGILAVFLRPLIFYKKHAEIFTDEIIKCLRLLQNNWQGKGKENRDEGLMQQAHPGADSC